MTQQHTAEELAQILDAMERKLEREERIRAQAPAMLDALRELLEGVDMFLWNDDPNTRNNKRHEESLALAWERARAIIAAIEEEG